jgi:tetratricopeptide (TPR) repeat protein
MSDLSLRQYLKKVESLLEGGHLEEGKAHARHILSYYPKNRDAYLLLGRILIAQRHWEEAAEVLRRLLGADPLNATAHQLLSQAYAQMFQLDNALFHLERAFDQTPNDRQIIAGLRELYSRSRGQKVEKIQLTAGAVAGQYLSNGLPDQAIDILKKASQRFPERIDLKLMLALSYQAAEMHIEAAEAAVDVLKNLPFALQANRIVAEFWLAQQRPSDARLNITRIEEVDPYYAQQIVTGEVDENRYMLPELDYKRLAEREMATADPDWLGTLSRGGAAASSSAEAFGDDLSWLMEDMSNQMSRPSDPALTTIFGDEPGSPADAPAADPVDDLSGLRPEVIKRLEALKHASNHGTVISSATPPAEPAPPDLSTIDNIDLSADWQEPSIPPTSDKPRTSTGLTGLLTSLGAGGEDETWMRDVLSGGGPTEPVATQTPDNLDFLADIGLQPPISPQSGRVSTGFTDLITPVEPAPSSPTDSAEALDDFFSQLEMAEDPLDLAHNPVSFFDQLEYEEDVETGFSSQVVAALDADKVSDFNVNPTEYVQPSARTDFFQQLEYHESEEDSALIAPNTVGELRSELVEGLDDASDPLAWMREVEIEYDENALNPFDAAAALDESGLMAPTEAPQDPLQWARQHEDVEVEPDPDDDPLAWMKSMGIEEVSAPLQEGVELGEALHMERVNTNEIHTYLEPQAAAEEQTTMTNDSNWQDDDLDSFDWLNEDADASAEEQLPSAAMPDWLDEAPTPAPAETSTGFTSMLDRLDPTSQAADDLSWMDKFNTNYLTDEEAADAAMSVESFNFDDFGSGDLASEEFTFDEAAASPTDDFASAFEMDTLQGADWLDSIGGDTSDVASFDEEPVAANEFGPMDEPPMSGDEFNFMAADDSQPDEFGFDESELEAFGTPDAELSEEPIAMNDFSFMTEEGASADEFGFDESELEAFGTPDAELSEEPIAMNDFSFMTEEGASADEFGFDEGELEAFGTPDAELSEEPIAMNDFDFMTEEGASADEFGFDEGELEAFGTPDAELSEEPIAMNDFSFMTEEGASADEFSFDEGELTEHPIVVNDFDFTAGTDLVSDELDEVLYQQEDTSFGFSTEELDVFSEGVQPAEAYAGDPNAADFTLEDDPERVDWFSDEQPIMSAEDEPNWLNAIKTGGEPNETDFALEDDEEAFEEGYAVASTPVDVEQAALEDDFAPAATVDENIAANAPDWLNSMVPGLDVDYENLPSDELIEEEFVLDGDYRSRSLEGFDAVNAGYDWLDELVEEETSNMLPVSAPPPVPVPLPPVPDFSRIAEPQPAPAAAAPTPVTRSFVFTAPPPWVERLRAMLGGGASTAVDEFDDFDFDDDDLK